MPNAIPCPKECTFDWVDFHKKLDIAIAHMIEEAGPDAHIEDYGPSYVSVMHFAEYSNAKKLFQEKGLHAEDSQKPDTA